MNIVTERVSNDELCYGLQEVDRLMPMPDGSTAWRRIQAVYVLRGQAIAEYTTDLGSSKEMENVAERKILTCAYEGDTPEDTVGEVMEMAARARGDDTFQKLKTEILEGSTLIKDFLQERSENWERIYNRSQFGPKYKKQRNGYDRRAAWG